MGCFVKKTAPPTPVQLCPLGKFVSVPGSCLKCPAGKFGRAKSGRDGVQQTGHGRCVQCPAGKFQSKKGTAACDTCKKGKNPAQGRKSCSGADKCKLGRYEVVDGVSYCFHCPAGKFGRELPGR